jgi:dTDP-D-glucose 4,6-dehydratase
MTRVLLTGAGGFAGSHCLEHLLAVTSWDVVATDSFRHKGKTDRITEVLDSHDGWRARATVITHDLTAPVTAQTAAKIGPVDYLIAYAAESHVDRSITDPVPFITNNVQVTLSTLEYARAARPRAVILISTDEVYGPEVAGFPHGEWAPILPSNPYCLSMGTDVITRRGLVPIEDFSITQHRTLSRDGATSGVPDGLARRTWQFPHTGEMLHIRTREGREEITCTEEHKFFARVTSHGSGGTKMVERRAADLSVGDRVCITRKLPFPQDVLEPEPEYARLLGYWMADGSYSEKRCRYVRLADQDRSMIDFYRAQAQAVCGVAPKSKTGAFGHVYKHGTKNCWYLQFASERLRDRIDLSDRMNVIEQAMNFGPKALGQFVAGWIDGDGSIAREKDIVKRAEISCSDPRLRRQLKFLLRRLGVIAVNDSDWDRVAIHDARSLMALFEAAPTRKWPSDSDFRTPQRKPGRAQNWMWARIERIDRVPSDGKVYDLEIGKYHNYLASYFLVHNSASKAATEAIGVSYWRTYGVPIIIVNSMNMFGERASSEKFVPKVIGQCLAGETVTIHGRPGDIGSRHWLHARNLADGVLFLLRYAPPAMFPAHAPAGVATAGRPDRYNVAAPDRVDNLTLARMIADAAGCELRYRLEDFHRARPGHDAHYGLDPGKIRALGWKPPVPFEPSLIQTVTWTLAHPEWLDE